MPVLGIIGTAGRGSDGNRLTARHFERMTALSHHIFQMIGADGLTSGGAAWADHCVIDLVLSGSVPADRLWLFLPCAFDLRTKRFVETSQRFCAGTTSNRYHDAFSTVTGRNSLSEIAWIIEGGRAHVTVDPRGFKPRNTSVAARADSALLAFTFGEERPWTARRFAPDTSAAAAGVADAGTADTWNKARCAKFHACLGRT